MKTSSRHFMFGFSGALLLASGVALAQTAFDRYQEAGATIDKAVALLNAITPSNAAEKKQHDKALAELLKAHDHVDCAAVRLNTPSGGLAVEAKRWENSGFVMG